VASDVSGADDLARVSAQSAWLCYLASRFDPRLKPRSPEYRADPDDISAHIDLIRGPD
jgi:hypothetical protein